MLSILHIRKVKTLRREHTLWGDWVLWLQSLPNRKKTEKYLKGFSEKFSNNSGNWERSLQKLLGDGKFNSSQLLVDC